MADIEKKYLDLTALSEVASKVNQKLKKVSVIPVSPSDGETILYTGTTLNNFIEGCIYKYNATEDEWELLDTSIILNGTNQTGDEASFYAPTSAGSAGQILVSNGANSTPTWSTFSGYCPTFEENSLCFYYGIIPEIEDTALVFEL